MSTTAHTFTSDFSQSSYRIAYDRDDRLYLVIHVESGDEAGSFENYWDAYDRAGDCNRKAIEAAADAPRCELCGELCGELAELQGEQWICRDCSPCCDALYCEGCGREIEACDGVLSGEEMVCYDCAAAIAVSINTQQLAPNYQALAAELYQLCEAGAPAEQISELAGRVEAARWASFRAQS